MYEQYDLRQLLIADLAVSVGVLEPQQVADALMRAWEPETGSGDLLNELIDSDLSADALASLEEEADRIVAEAGGNLLAAVTKRGGIDRWKAWL